MDARGDRPKTNRLVPTPDSSWGAAADAIGVFQERVYHEGGLDDGADRAVRRLRRTGRSSWAVPKPTTQRASP